MDIKISVENDSFSLGEIEKLIQCIREIEQNNPKRHVEIFLDCPEMTIEDMKRVIQSTKPGFPYMKIIYTEKG